MTRPKPVHRQRRFLILGLPRSGTTYLHRVLDEHPEIEMADKGPPEPKFFVDDEKYPSTFGTGSEDYFGYAWCDPGLFQRPFHSLTMTSGNKGHQSVLRWHVADSIPFQTSFEGCIEKYYRTEEKGTLYACTVCWYLAPGGGVVTNDETGFHYTAFALKRKR